MGLSIKNVNGMAGRQITSTKLQIQNAKLSVWSASWRIEYCNLFGIWCLEFVISAVSGFGICNLVLVIFSLLIILDYLFY
ncbi:MAG: hypothetical protein A2663_04235 [Candidatus Buchananbacteria bacterium RIFCSPHIGHO2_01_FULL_46_12]|uniref:Uncharacterized protein n=1 Tax=Candidatus Buchananbacteria bacterium RIFCSPHIGHO2_01_FULL_46_12 TaxID=1797536 RepID=A0A1G1Y590_9BACT|nr:MAG: hypothetical protein A2663_04235 [Candidatus Buchananbacteria bacterium RIFCSPHIGHO2_01_FULL_46_12]